jgi:hypothetical protein
MQKAVALGAAAAFVFAAGVASATIEDESGCRSTIAKNISKLNSTAHKAQVGCVKNVLNGKAPAPLSAGEKCHQMATADTGGKVAGANTKFQDAVNGLAGEKCDDAVDTLSLAAYGPNCQVSASANGNYNQVSDCLADAAEGAAELLFGEILNPDYPGILAHANAGDIEKCANAIAKNATKSVSTIIKERTKAQNGIDKDDTGVVVSYTQYNTANTKINDSITKTLDAIQGACEPPDVPASALILLGSCDPNSTLAGIKTCVEDAVRDTAEGLASMAYINANEFPTQADVFINSGTDTTGTGSALDGITGARRNRTQLDAGFTGLGHKVDVIDGFEGAVELACGGDGECTVSASCDKNNCRCSNDVTIICDEPFVVDVDDCGAGTCQVFFGPPLDLSASGTPTCVVNRIDSLAGTVSLANGNSDTTVNNVSIVYTDEDGQNQPCPKCVGGTEGGVGFNDGTRTGTCDGGAGYPSQGDPCDANGFSSTFGLTSYDCQPNPGKNASGAGLDITLEISDEPADLVATTTCGGALPAEDCHCRICSGLPANNPCNTDADCPGGQTCSTNGSGVAQMLPNGCASSAFACPASGECAADSTLFCDLFVRADGRGIYPCSIDGDCVTIAGECPGGNCGTCTLSEPVPCLPASISAATGTNSGGEHAVLGTNFCIPPTSNPGINAAAGSPGPGRVLIDFNFDILCDDGITEMDYGGFNCP